MAKRNWKELSWTVWRDQWQEILALMGIATTFSTVKLPVWLIGFWIVVIMGLVVSVIQAFKQAKKMTKEKHVPIAILIGKDKNTADAMWSDVIRAMARDPWNFYFEQYRKDFGLGRSDWFIHEEEPLPKDSVEHWVKLARRFRRRLEEISRVLPGRRIFHVFFNGPLTMALGMGASIGTMFEVVVHQYFPASGQVPYSPVVDFHKLSEMNPRGAHFLEDAIIDKFRYVDKEGEPGDGNELYVSVFVAKDDPKPAVEQLVKSRIEEGGKRLPTFHVRQKMQRTLVPEDDWIRCAREILTLFFERVSSREQVHLFLSVPVALAFALGMGIEHFLKVRVHSWFAPDRKYYQVLELEKLGRMS